MSQQGVSMSTPELLERLRLMREKLARQLPLAEMPLSAEGAVGYAARLDTLQAAILTIARSQALWGAAMAYRDAVRTADAECQAAVDRAFVEGECAATSEYHAGREQAARDALFRVLDETRER